MVQRLLSWRIAVGVGVGAAMVAAGLGVAPAVAVGVAVWVAISAVGGPAGPRRSSLSAIDPFTVGEPWRQFVRSAQRAAERAHRTVADTPDGPIRDRLDGIIERLDDSVSETWRIAKRGDEIDDAIRRLDPTALRSKLTSLRNRRAAAPSPELDAAIESVESQLATTGRLQERSSQTADTLRLAQARLDELVTRTAEIAVGAGDTDAYAHDVDDLVIELEALRQAIQEV